MALTKLVDGVRVDMLPEEEADLISYQQNWITNVLPFQERNKAFIEAKRSALSFDKEEIDVLLAGYLEVKLVRLAILLGQSAGSVDTPVIDAFNAVFPGQTKLQIAQTIENRAQTYFTATATALANKIKNGG